MKYLTLLLSFYLFFTTSEESQGQSKIELDSLDLQGFMDGLMHNLMDERKVAGATVTIVREGQLLLSKGYGFADVHNQIPVDPEKTLFRIGSITKLFVWTAVMQLASQGKLDLNADVNIYLDDFKVPEKFGQPITLKNLLSHTPGFEDYVMELFVNDEAKLLPLKEILKKEMPERVRPPFTQGSYSNHGTGIAAYIVEKVSGLSFHNYANKFILEPLDMHNTTMMQPLPAKWKGRMSKGYIFDKIFEEKDFELVPLYPVGGASSTATDMARLMQVFLQKGTLDNFSLLDTATFETMLQPLHQHHPDVNPLLYGFMDLSQKGNRVFGHGGDTFWFHSLLALLPEHDFGIFISFNTGNVMNGYIKVLEALLDRYFPDTRTLESPMVVDQEWIQQFEGEYKVNRYQHSNFTKIISLISRYQVTAEKGKLLVKQPTETKYYVPIGESTFREEYNNNKIAFGKNEKGEIHYLFDGMLSIYAMEKVPTQELSPLHISILAISLMLALLVLFYWPLSARIRRNYLPKNPNRKLLPLGGKWVAWINYSFYLIFLIGLAVIMSNPFEIVYGVPTSLKVLLLFPVLMLGLSLLMLFFSIRYLGNPHYSGWGKAFYIVITLISMLAIWQLYYWNFLGWQYA